VAVDDLLQRIPQPVCLQGPIHTQAALHMEGPRRHTAANGASHQLPDSALLIGESKTQFLRGFFARDG